MHLSLSGSIGRLGVPMRVEAPGQRQDKASSLCLVCSVLTKTSWSGSKKGAMSFIEDCCRTWT